MITLNQQKMKKIHILLLIAFSSYSINAQEKIIEFKTTHGNIGSGAIEIPILFELYTDKLVLNYIDKKQIKQMVKIGQATSQIFPYTFTKEVNQLSVLYKYETAEIQIMVILEGNPKPSVTIKSKDSFLGTVTSNQVYFSLLN